MGDRTRLTRRAAMTTLAAAGAQILCSSQSHGQVVIDADDGARSANQPSLGGPEMLAPPPTDIATGIIPTSRAAGDEQASGPTLQGTGGHLRPQDLQAITEGGPRTRANLPAMRALWLVNGNTSEEVCDLFWNAGTYDKHGYTLMCHMMRDWRENMTVQMDPMLLHLLWAVQYHTNFRQPIQINSGYRTEKTNTALLPEGAAINSFHMHRRACDIVVKSVAPQDIARYAQSLKLGGIGFYGNRFTHVDTGPIRTWVG